MEIPDIVGKTYVFEDGNSIEVKQIKERSDGPWVTTLIYSGPGIPRQEVQPLPTFIKQFGHLFGLKEPPSLPTR